MILTLAYHKVGVPEHGRPTRYYVSTETFTAQMKALAQSSWRVVSMATLVDLLDGNETFPPLVALVTFDDGYRHLRHTALPALSEHGLPSSISVPTAYIGGSNTFDAGIEPHEPICSWEDLAFMHDAGMSVASHAVSHRRFSTLSPETQLSELTESRSLLERKLGVCVRSFVYPYGDTGSVYSETRDLVRRAGYALAFGYGGTAIPAKALDRFAMTRVAVGETTDFASMLRRRVLNFPQ